MTRKHKNYRVDEVLLSLRAKRSIQVSEAFRTLTIKLPREGEVSEIGIKTKGKIDFLRNHNSWIVMYN